MFGANKIPSNDFSCQNCDPSVSQGVYIRFGIGLILELQSQAVNSSAVTMSELKSLRRIGELCYNGTQVGSVSGCKLLSHYLMWL